MAQIPDMSSRQPPQTLRANLAEALRQVRQDGRPLPDILARWPRHSGDEAVRAIGETLTVLAGTFRPTAVHLDRAQRDALLARCERFLRSDQVYRWPDPRARLILGVAGSLAGVVAVLVIAGIALSNPLLVNLAGAIFPVGLLLLIVPMLSTDRSRFGYRSGRYLTDPTWPFTTDQLDDKPPT